MESNRNRIIAEVAALAIGCLTIYLMKRTQEKKEPTQPEFEVALLGDIGGTNVRLILKRLCLKTRTSTVLLDLKKYDSQHSESLYDVINKFLN